MFGKPGRRARATALSVAAASTCVLLAACAPVKMGAAALVGDQRITQTTLDTQVSDLQAAAKHYGAQISLPAGQMPAMVLGWLIRFQIWDQVTADAGITLTQAQAQAGIKDINDQAKQVASQQGLSPQAALINAGISPQMLPDLGRLQAQQLAVAEHVNGGKPVTTQAEDNAVSAELSKAQCSAAKSLNIQVNPQFGRIDYTQYTVVATPDTLSRPAGTPTPASVTGLTPDC